MGEQERGVWEIGKEGKWRTLPGWRRAGEGAFRECPARCDWQVLSTVLWHPASRPSGLVHEVSCALHPGSASGTFWLNGAIGRSGVLGLNSTSARSSFGALNTFLSLCAPRRRGLRRGAVIAPTSRAAVRNRPGSQRAVGRIICIVALPLANSNVTCCMKPPDAAFHLRAGLPPGVVINIKRVPPDTMLRPGPGQGKD